MFKLNTLRHNKVNNLKKWIIGVGIKPRRLDGVLMIHIIHEDSLVIRKKFLGFILPLMISHIAASPPVKV